MFGYVHTSAEIMPSCTHSLGHLHFGKCYMEIQYGHAFVSQINMLSHPLPEAMLRSLRIKYLRKGDILLS